MERSGSKIGSSALDILSVRYLSDSQLGESGVNERSNESCKFGSHQEYRWYLKSWEVRSPRKWVQIHNRNKNGALGLSNGKERKRNKRNWGAANEVKKKMSLQISIRNYSSLTAKKDSGHQKLSSGLIIFLSSLRQFRSTKFGKSPCY